MDVRTGDMLAMVSSPVMNPDYSSNEPARLSDAKLRPQINRATYENYAPGSIFKPVVAWPRWKTGLIQTRRFTSRHRERSEPRYVMVGAKQIQDTVPPGDYDFRRAIERSSNAYFITVGLRTGIQKIVQLAGKFHLGSA